MKRIIISAGAWGYGPCSTAIMIASRLKEDYIIDFVGEGIAHEFAQAHTDIFDTIYNNVDELQKEYQFAISIIDPSILLWASINSIYSICIDNIYWIWEWSQDFLNNVIEGKYNPRGVGDIDSVRRVTANLEKYGDYSFMYSSPSHVFLQGFTSSVTDNILQFKDKLEIIDPIVDTSHKKTTNKNKILVTCSGMKNPYINDENIITYIKMLKKIFGNVIDDRFIFTVPLGFEAVGRKILGYDGVFCLSHSEMLDAINESIVVFAPAGMAIMFESIAYETMIYVLPEQHDGSYLCDKRIKYIKLCNNSGCSVARNEGLRVAAGEYVVFLDSDDKWESEHLMNAINIFKNQNVGIYLSFWYTECGGKREKICKSEEDFIYLNEVITELNPKVVDNGYLFDKGLFEYASMEWFYFFHINTLVVSRKILEQSGVFDETLSTCEDTDFILRLLSFGNVFFSQSYDFIYQQSEDGIYSFLSYIGDHAGRNRLQYKEVNKISIIELNKIRAKFNSLAYYNQHNAKMSFEDFEQEIYNYIYKKYAYISYLYSLNDINLSRYYLNLAIKYCRDIKDIDYLKSMRDRPYFLDLANVNKW